MALTAEYLIGYVDCCRINEAFFTDLSDAEQWEDFQDFLHAVLVTIDSGYEVDYYKGYNEALFHHFRNAKDGGELDAYME